MIRDILYLSYADNVLDAGRDMDGLQFLPGPA
jgi:hypothetical protein